MDIEEQNLKKFFCSIPIDYKLMQTFDEERNIKLDNHICFITDYNNLSYMYSDRHLLIGQGIIEETW